MRAILSPLPMLYACQGCAEFGQFAHDVGAFFDQAPAGRDGVARLGQGAEAHDSLPDLRPRRLRAGVRAALARGARHRRRAQLRALERGAPRPFTLEEEATLADAALAMARHGFRHVVVTRDGKLAGVVSERDLFALQRLGLRRTAERIRQFFYGPLCFQERGDPLLIKIELPRRLFRRSAVDVWRYWWRRRESISGLRYTA